MESSSGLYVNGNASIAAGDSDKKRVGDTPRDTPRFGEAMRSPLPLAEIAERTDLGPAFVKHEFG